MFARDTYLDEMIPCIGSDEIKVLSGVKGAGKHTLLRRVIQEMISSGVEEGNIIYVDLEDFRYSFVDHYLGLRREIERHMSGRTGRLRLFIADVDRIDDWREMLQDETLGNPEIWMTTSTRHLLKNREKESGRYRTFTVFPLSFKEFHSYLSELDPTLDRNEIFTRFFHQGGMPGCLKHGDRSEKSVSYRQQLLRRIEFEDICLRYRIRRPVVMEKMILHMAASTGRMFSDLSLSGMIKLDRLHVSPLNAHQIMENLENSYLFSCLKRRDVITDTMDKSDEMVYFFDHGIREALCGDNAEIADYILENIVLIELVRRGYSVSVGMNGARRIDFVAERPDERLYVEVCESIYRDNRESWIYDIFGGIPEEKGSFLLLTMDRGKLSRGAVKHRNLIEFLLS